MKTISVIVPMYNSFQMMKRNLDVLFAQKEAEIELIIVDDCSTDDSYDQALNLASKSTINIIVQKNEKNSGPGASRNKGIELATGDYILFVDSDDYLNDRFTEVLAPLLEQEIDCIIFDYAKVDKDGIKLAGGKSLGCGELSCGFLDTKKAFVYAHGATMCKIYRREMIEKCGARFGEYYRNEDMPFTKHAIAMSEQVYYCAEELYMYVQHQSSLMHNDELCDEKNCQRAFGILSERLAGKGFEEELLAIELREVLNNTVLIKFEKKVPRKEIVKYIRSHYLKKHLENEYFVLQPKYVKIISFCAYYRSIVALYFIVKYRRYVNSKETKNHERT